MRTELPGDLLRRRLGRRPGPESTDDQPGDETPADDPNSLVPQWLPDGAADDGWLAKVRADPGRAGAIGLSAVAAVAVLVTVFAVIRDRPEPVVAAKLPAVEMVSSDSTNTTGSVDPPATERAGADQPVVVSVVGLVHEPGLVTLTAGARVADALSAAGGALDGADTAGLNMARLLTDGEQIVVGLAAPAGQPRAFGSSVTGGPSGGPSGPDGPPGSATTAGSPGSTRNGPINLNTATAADLDTLPGVGPVTAAAILAWRTEHGKFTSVDQLAQVDGIGPARLEKLRPLVRI